MARVDDPVIMRFQYTSNTNEIRVEENAANHAAQSEVSK